jgi:hypothetical protein
MESSFTSHVFLSFKNNECISTMRFLLLVTLLVGMCIFDDADLGTSQ